MGILGGNNLAAADTTYYNPYGGGWEGPEAPSVGLGFGGNAEDRVGQQQSADAVLSGVLTAGAVVAAAGCVYGGWRGWKAVKGGIDRCGPAGKPSVGSASAPPDGRRIPAYSPPGYPGTGAPPFAAAVPGHRSPCGGG